MLVMSAFQAQLERHMSTEYDYWDVVNWHLLTYKFENERIQKSEDASIWTRTRGS